MTTSIPRVGEVLSELSRTLNVDRQATHGDPFDTLGMTAELWTIVFGRKFSRAEVAQAMQLLKIARSRHGNYNPDDDQDNLGYGVLKTVMEQMERAGTEYDEHRKEYPAQPVTPVVYMGCRTCRAVTQFSANQRFSCPCCGGKYGKMLGDKETL